MLDVLRLSDMPTSLATSLVYEVSSELIQKDKIYEQSIVFYLKNDAKRLQKKTVKECWKTRLRHCVYNCLLMSSIPA